MSILNVVVLCGFVIYLCLAKAHIEIRRGFDYFEKKNDIVHDDSSVPTSQMEVVQRLKLFRQNMLQSYSEWEMYKTAYSKLYADQAQDTERFLAFLSSHQIIQRHNEKFKNGESSYEMGLNDISDLCPEEYQTLNGYKMTDEAVFGSKMNSSVYQAPMNVAVPSSLDWREHGFVTPVKDQRRCGSCWAFSSTGALEGQHKRVTGNLVSLSEQNLIDCSGAYGNNGCHGGSMSASFRYAIDNHGVDREESYPYESAQNSCRFNRQSIGTNVVNFVDVAGTSEDNLKVIVATQGPVSVAIDASHRGFQYYKQGVYYDSECSSQQLGHAVLLVGYGSDPQYGDYWLVKNSWGQSWGDNGYIKMARNRNNNCGIATRPVYPVVG